MRIVNGNLKRTVAGLSGAAGVIGLMLAAAAVNGHRSGLVARAHAQEAPAVPVEFICSNATLGGTYGFQRHGTKTDGTMITSVGIITFDGLGNVVGGQEWTMRNGVMTDRPIPLGTYVVNDDCTGQILDPTLTPISQFVVVHRGSQFLAMSLGAGNSVWARFEKVADGLGRFAIAPRRPSSGAPSNRSR